MLQAGGREINGKKGQSQLLAKADKRKYVKIREVIPRQKSEELHDLTQAVTGQH